MNTYKTIIAAIDLSPDSQNVLNKAKGIAEATGASLHLVHIVECLNLNYGGDIPLDFSDIQLEMQNQAKIKLAQIGGDAAIPALNQHLLVGRPESQINELAEEIKANLIVVGSHPRRGLSLLFGSTADGVVHNAECDVLAVRTRKSDGEKDD